MDPSRGGTSNKRSIRIIAHPSTNVHRLYSTFHALHNSHDCKQVKPVKQVLKAREECSERSTDSALPELPIKCLKVHNFDHLTPRNGPEGGREGEMTTGVTSNWSVNSQEIQLEHPLSDTGDGSKHLQIYQQIERESNQLEVEGKEELGVCSSVLLSHIPRVC